MLDIKFLRENPDVVKENIRKKFQDSKLVLVDEVIELDKKSRAGSRLTSCEQKQVFKADRGIDGSGQKGRGSGA